MHRKARFPIKEARRRFRRWPVTTLGDAKNTSILSTAR